MQIIGNLEAQNFLDKSVSSGKLAPSYLFVGPRGVGKALMARWFAQRIFCQSAGERPCGMCSACRRIESGNFPDFANVGRIVSKGAKEGIVGQVRAIISELYKAPYEADNRMFVFEDAGALTVQAQNCLLKTVEEPSPNLVLVLLAETPSRVLPTILSRCCVVRFQPVDRYDIAAALVERGCEENRANVLAAISEGAPGRALQLLENEEAWEFRRLVLDRCIDLVGGDLWAALDTAWGWEELVPRKNVVKEEDADSDEEKNGDGEFTPSLAGLLELLSSYYRDAMILAAGAPVEVVVNCDYQLALQDLASRRGPNKLERDLEHLTEAVTYLNSNVQPRLMLQHLCVNLLS